MANQTIFKLHTVMPRSFDFETNFPYLPRERLLIPTSRPQNSPSLNATASLFICLIKGAVSQYSHTSSSAVPSSPVRPLPPPRVLWSLTKLSTPPRPGSEQVLSFVQISRARRMCSTGMPSPSAISVQWWRGWGQCIRRVQSGRVLARKGSDDPWDWSLVNQARV
jgi:hypothetical protein